MEIQTKEDLNNAIISMIDQSEKKKEKQIKLIHVKGFHHYHGKEGEPFEHNALLIGNKYYFLIKYVGKNSEAFTSGRDFIENANIITECLLGTTDLQGYKIVRILDSLVDFNSKNINMNLTSNQQIVFQTLLEYLKIEKQIPSNLNFVRPILTIKEYEKNLSHCILF